MTITEAEILESLRAAFSPDCEGFTSREFAEALDIGIHNGRENMRKLFRAGRIRCVGHRQEFRMDGKPTPVPVYQLVEG